MNKPEIVLHIGTEKTGTTTIQTFLTANREKLIADSILYPSSPGGSNHIKLSAFALDDNKIESVRRNLGVVDSSTLSLFRRGFLKDLVNEVSSVKCEKIILSNEHCHSRLKSVQEISILKDFLRQVSNNISIVVYFRRQDELAVSRYSTEIRSGFQPDSIFPFHPNIPYYYDYYKIYKNWADVFGPENIIVKIFDRSRFLQNDLILDFMDAVGCSWKEEYTRPPVINKSLTSDAQYLLSKLNKDIPVFIENRPNMNRQNLSLLMEKNFSGKGMMPTKKEAMAFYGKFKQGNDKLKNECFPECDGSIFNESFLQYPDKSELYELSIDSAISMFSVLWNEKCAENRKIRAQNNILQDKLENMKKRLVEPQD
jgi:hypothetical protein